MTAPTVYRRPPAISSRKSGVASALRTSGQIQYQMLPSFIFGFLLTTFPKWTKQPDLSPRQFIPVGIGLFTGQLLTLFGATGSHLAITAGVIATACGWTAALVALVPILWREDGTTWHARSCIAALALGFAGLMTFLAFSYSSVQDVTHSTCPICCSIATRGFVVSSRSRASSPPRARARRNL